MVLLLHVHIVSVCKYMVGYVFNVIRLSSQRNLKPIAPLLVETSEMLKLSSICWHLQSNRMFFWWELCKLPLQHWYLIDSLSWASCNPSEQVAIAFVAYVAGGISRASASVLVANPASYAGYRFRAVFKNIWKAVCVSKFLLWLMMANIHYNRSTTLEKREKIIALCTSLWSGQFKTGEEVWLSPQTVSIYWQP